MNGPLPLNFLSAGGKLLSLYLYCRAERLSRRVESAGWKFFALQGGDFYKRLRSQVRGSQTTAQVFEEAAESMNIRHYLAALAGNRHSGDASRSAGDLPGIILCRLLLS